MTTTINAPGSHLAQNHDGSDGFDLLCEIESEPETQAPGQPEVLVVVYAGPLATRTFRAPGPEWVFVDVKEYGRGRRTRHCVVWEKVQ